MENLAIKVANEEAFVSTDRIPNGGVDNQLGTNKETKHETEQGAVSKMTPSTEIENLWEQVFQNPIILRQIFKFFPTSSLLKRYSLVNKFWNKEVRIFIRDHRKCLANTPTSIDNQCEFLNKLDELCCVITEQGRVIPYNSLMLSTPCDVCEDLQDSSRFTFGEFKSEMKIRYLYIGWFISRDDGDCSVHHCLVKLLRRSAPHLRKLKIESAAPLFENMLAETYFPQLEEIYIYRNTRYNEVPVVDQNILRKILEVAPNCKSVRMHDNGTLYVAVPPQKYELLTELECCGALYGDKFEDENLLPKLMESIIAKKPPVKKLLITPPVACRFPSLFSQDQRAELAAAYAKEELVFNSVLPQLLQAFRQSLRTISIQRRFPVAQLSSSPLPNLKKLVVKEDIQFSLGIEGFWTSIISADFEQL